jgi:hypothetical protein
MATGTSPMYSPQHSSLRGGNRTRMGQTNGWIVNYSTTLYHMQRLFKFERWAMTIAFAESVTTRENPDTQSSGKINFPTALTPGKPLVTGGPEAGLDTKKTFLYPPEIKPRLFCRSIHSPVTLPDHNWSWSVSNHYPGNDMKEPRKTMKCLRRYRRRSGIDPNTITRNSGSVLPTGWTDLRRQMLSAIHGCLLTWNESLSDQNTWVRCSDSTK